MTSNAATHSGPLVPTAGSAAVLRPLSPGPFRLEGGFWHRRQVVNSERSIPHGWRQLRAYGQWDNLRRAARQAPGQHTGRPYTDSDVYKLAEAQAWDAQCNGAGSRASARLSGVADLVAAAQEPNGYVNSWFQCTGSEHFSDLQMGHEMYCAGHLIQAAVAAARTLGQTELLGAATAFADHLVGAFAGRFGICGHPQIELALVELFRHTGRRQYLELARQMVDQRGYGRLGSGWYGSSYYQDDVPIRAGRELNGHCVRALYLAAGATDVFLETGDQDLLAALLRQWEHTVATKTYLTGGVGCRRKTEAFGAAYELPPDHAFNETCAAVANIMWSWRMLLATGESRFADHIERILYNVLAAAVSDDGESFSYVNTLHRRGSAMEHGDKAPYRKPWFDCACCPPNLMRTIASLGHLVATTDARGVQLHQYGSGSGLIDVGDGTTLAFTVDTDYPWRGLVDIRVEDAPPYEYAVGLRVPAWCRSPRLLVEDVPVEPTMRCGYATLRRAWRPGDRITLDLRMAPRWTRPARRVDAVRGCVAIEVGPLVYCFEDSDLPEGDCLDDLTLDGGRLQLVHRQDLFGGTVVVRCDGRRQAGATPTWPYPTGTSDPPGTRGMPLTLTAIPYFLWDNRGRGQMRVWMPLSPGATGEDR